MKYKLYRLLIVGILGSISCAHAVTFNVNSVSDEVDANIGDGVCASESSVCTLRAAVQESNAYSGKDVVVLPSGTYLLSAGSVGEDEAAGGDLDINDELVIEGVGMPVIDGWGREAVFTVSAATTMSGITIQNGLNGIDLNGSLLLDDVVVKNNDRAGILGAEPYVTRLYDVELVLLNSSVEQNGFGNSSGKPTDAIDGEFESLEIRGSHIANNGLRGVRASGEVLIAYSTITGNEGGGVVMYSGYINDTIISGNSSVGIGNGAGIAMTRGTLVRVTVDSNSAGENFGGGISVVQSVTLIDSVISNNSATRGGGVYISGFLYGNSEIVNSALVANHATDFGGGLSNSSAVEVVNTTIAQNSSDFEAGAIVNFSDINLVNVTVADNTSLANTAIYTEMYGGAATLVRNSILKGVSDCEGDTSIPIWSLGNNIYMDSTCGTTLATDQVADAGLDAWQATTMSYPLLATSPAINSADPVYCSGVDQLRHLRDSQCDVGAREYGAAALEHGVVGFAAESYTTTEEAGEVLVTLRRTGGADGEVSVLVRTQQGDASNFSDYTDVEQSVVWADGDAGDKTVTIAINNDSTYEGEESLYMSLVDPQGGVGVDIGHAVISIAESDINGGMVSFIPLETDTIAEGVGSITVSVSRYNGSNGVASVEYTTVDGTATAGEDYVSASGVITWQDGETGSKTITIELIDDDQIEAGDKSFSVQLLNPSTWTVLGAYDTFTLHIQDDDTTYINLNDAVNVSETTSEANITVVRTGPTNVTSTVSYTTVDVSATAGSDYVAQSGSVVFDVGETQKVITIKIINDNEIDGDEALEVRLTSVENAVLGENVSAVQYIIDDDDCPEDYQCIEIAPEGGGGGGSIDPLWALLLLALVRFHSMKKGAEYMVVPLGKRCMEKHLNS